MGRLSLSPDLIFELFADDRPGHGASGGTDRGSFGVSEHGTTDPADGGSGQGAGLGLGGTATEASVAVPPRPRPAP